MATDVAGVMVRNEADAARLVEAQLRGSGPWSDPNDQTAADGLGRALSAAGPWLPVFARTIGQHLEDGDATVRTLAVYLSERVAPQIGAPALVQALARSPKLFDGVKPVGHPTNQPDLRWSLLLAIGRATGPKDTQAIDVLRKAAHEARGYWLLDDLARADLEWLLAHAREVVPKDALGGTLGAMPDTKRRQALIRALAPWTAAEKKEALEGPFWKILPDAAEVRKALEQL